MLGPDTILWWLLKGSAILVIGWVATLLLRRQPAAVRHAVWTIAVIGQLLVPVANLVPMPMPELAVPMPSWAPAEPSVAAPPAGLLSPGRTVSLPPSLPAIERVRSAEPLSVLPILLVAGSALCLLRLVLARRALARMTRQARPASAAWLSLVDELRQSIGIARPVAVLVSEHATIPITCGVLRPQIVLPRSAQAWPMAIRRHVLLHELAHVRRADTLWLVSAQLTLAALWFNPLLWWAVRQLRSEAEHACDDYVLRAGERPSSYARTLVELVRAAASPTTMAALSMAQRSDLERRVGAILDPVRNTSPRTALRAVTIAMLLAIILPLAIVHRQAETATAAVTPARGCRPLVIPNCSFLETSGTLTLPDSTTTHYFFLHPEPERWLEAWFSLDARFTADDHALVPTPGLHALVREQRDGIDRAVYLDEAHGRLQHRYLVAGRSATWDRAAERWLAAVMPDVIRRTSAGITDRAKRILARDGIDGLLAEIPRLGVADVRRCYLLELLQVPPAQLPRAQLLAAARQELGAQEPSLASFLAEVIARDGASEEVRAQVLAEVRSLRRGTSRLMVLQAMVEHPDPRVQLAALENIALLREQVWRRDLLQASAPHALAAGHPLADSWFVALENLHAPLYRRELAAKLQQMAVPAPIADRLASL